MPESNACITKEAVSSDMTSGDLVVRIRKDDVRSRELFEDSMSPAHSVFKTALLFTFQEDRKYFQFHFDDPNIPFRNLSELALWREDEMFTDQRLAGSNPMVIQRVSRQPGSQASTNNCHVKTVEKCQRWGNVSLLQKKTTTKPSKKHQQRKPETKT